jgi:hypothetical protein
MWIRFRFHMTRLYSVRADVNTDPKNCFRAAKGMPLDNSSWLF